MTEPTATTDTQPAPPPEEEGLVVTVIAVTIRPLFGTVPDPALAAEALADSLPLRFGTGGAVFEVVDTMYLASPGEETPSHDAATEDAPVDPQPHE